MDYYLEITLLPDAEFKSTVLMNVVYTKLHKAIHDLHATDIGVSFPKYQVNLGNVLRIHGDLIVLGKLHRQSWLGGISGYCTQSEITAVPPVTKYRTVSRKQSNMSHAKLQRLIKRGSISEDSVKSYCDKMLTKELGNPYLELQSGSNGHRHRRYIKFGDIVDSPVLGEFDSFGLSKTATIPWFD
jgi:CRISPR-associated endonuclease Csy4